MAAITPKQKQLQGEVLKFSLKPNQSLSQFNIPEHFKGQCKKYLHDSPPYGNSGSQSYQESTNRFCVLNFDGLIFYNYYKGPEGEEFEYCTGYATLEDVKNWQTAIKCLQRYCLNLLLAPRRQDFHEIKFSTGYYQYNIAKNFKGAVKILEAMGYRVSHMKNLPVKAKLKEPKNLPEIAKVLVDLVLFDFELTTLEKCIKEYGASCGLECSIMDAWNARKNTDGGVQNALGYLHNYPPSVNRSSVKSNNEPANNVNARAHHHKDVPVDKGAFDQRVMAPQTNNKSAHNVVEKPFDPSTLPPPYIEPNVEFESVAHINPSSHYDDENELIKDSTQLGYRNPPEVKPQVKPPSNLQPMRSTPDYLAATSGYGSPDRLQSASSSSAPVVMPSNENGGSSKAHLEVSSSSAFLKQGHVNARHLGNDDSTYSSAKFSGSTVATGGPQSLPSVTVSTSANVAESITTNAQLGSMSRLYNRQKSVPGNTTLSIDSEKMAPIANVTTNNRQLADSQVLTAAVPIADQPTPEVSQAPSTADSKFGSTNLGHLKNKLQHKKEVTKEVVQHGGAGYHPQSTGAYANNEITFQGASDSTNKPSSKKTDLISLRSRLEKTKEEREKTVVAGGVSKNASDYQNVNDFGLHNPENPVMINNPRDKKPKVTPRTITPANQAGNITHSASSASSSSRTYRLWQCAHCETINEAYLTFCGSCKVARGKMADRSYLCEFCQLMIFIQNKRDRADTCCPRCKLVFESTL